MLAIMNNQLILVPYACADYIVSHIGKGQRGISNLLRHACKEAKICNADKRQEVRRLGTSFISC